MEDVQHAGQGPSGCCMAQQQQQQQPVITTHKCFYLSIAEATLSKWHDREQTPGTTIESCAST